MQPAKKRPTLVRLPLIVAMLGCLYGTQALAQDAQTEEEAAQTSQEETSNQSRDGKSLGTITVTGSLLRRDEYESASPIHVITPESNTAAGQIEVAEFLQQSSIAAGSTQISNQFSGFVTEGGIGTQTLSLRGMGANRSLVLLNGSRPGPAGTRGQVGAFDLNVIPSIILQKVEVLKDGSSSIYGSDAVAGVANLITRKNISRPEVHVAFRIPQHGGGEVYDISGLTGWTFSNGSISLAANYYQQRAVKVKDRDFFRCPRDNYWDDYGNALYREDRSILAGTQWEGCIGSIYNAVDDALTGVRYVPSTDGSTVGLISGYRPNVNTTYANSAQASTTQVLYGAWQEAGDIVSKNSRASIYGSADFSFQNGLNWTAELLLNQRKTESRRFRQFFPVIGGATAPVSAYRYANDPTFEAPVPSGVAMPIMPFASNTDITVDYYYVNTGLDGNLPFSNWTWKSNVSFSRSKGTYGSLVIDRTSSGDVRYSDDAPVLNYFDPGFLDGSRMAELVATIGRWDEGVTTYDQLVFNAVATGDLFELPAGTVGAAIGAEYRRYSIDDQPGILSRTGQLWGQSSANVTKGEDNVKELFAEVEVPLLKGLPGVESLSLNMSARAFDYDSLADTDNVWKLGLNWQIIPSLRARASLGTSFRAPGLYELYLGNQSAFVNQSSIDPCIRWGESSNEYVQANCAAAGIPNDYTGGASSATVVTGGGAGVLKPEHSRAFTAGLVWTPAFAPINVAFDYFKYEVLDQISELTAGNILSGCYTAQVYPNDFCTRFTRNSPTDATAPNAITLVNASYININKQVVRGYDLQMNYENSFAAGKLTLNAAFTYLLDDIEQTFSSSAASGYESTNWAGNIARPKTVGGISASFKRNDWTYSWSMDYVGSSRAIFSNPQVTYYGYQNAWRDIALASRLYHSLSVGYGADKWSVLAGVRNVFDTTPPNISSGPVTRYGNISAFATQYDWLGRSAFVRFNYKF